MKNMFKFLGIIALAAVIGFSLASCGDGDGGNGDEGNTSPKKVTLTNFTSPYTGEWQLWLIQKELLAAITDIIAAIQCTPENGSISGELFEIAENGPGDKWTGNGEYYVYLVPRHPGDNLDVICYRSKNKISFNQTETNISFSGNFQEIGAASQFRD